MAKTKKRRNNKKNAKEVSNIESIKSDFITVASHQLRTPISAIRWSLDTLLGGRLGQLSDKQKEVVQEAYQNNKFMVKVVNDLLRVSRIEEKGVKLVSQFVDLAKLTKEILARHKIFAHACNCKITLTIANNLPKAYIDPLQIKSVLDSLIDNAIRYGQSQGEVKISFKKAKDYLLVEIQDKGIGIPQDQKHLIFSKFFRARNAMKAQTEGLGLNLYLAKKIVEASGGKIDLESVENRGTTLHVYLPLSKNKLDNGAVKEKEKEEPEDILKKEREFVSITVHELKAPLGISKWSLEMLKSDKPGKLNKTQLELIDQIYSGNERLLVLVRDLLNLSKLQEGKFEIETKKIQPEKIITSVIKDFQVEAKRKKIKLQYLKPKKSLPQVLADSSRVAQVATNLISNAVKYTPDNGKVTIAIKRMLGSQLKAISDKTATINISYVDNKKGYLVFSVKDTGIGISFKDQKKLFTRFFRGEEVLKSEAEGTGLGLYITKSIVNLHQGDIWFTSQLGKGSTFYFTLPVA